MRRQRGVRQDPGRVARRIAVGDEQEVTRSPVPCSRCSRRRGRGGREACGRARATANQARNAAVEAMPPTLQPADQSESGVVRDRATRRRRTTRRRRGRTRRGAGREREHEPGGDPAARLARRRLDLEVDGIAGAAAEGRVRRRGQVDVRAHLHRVAQVRDHERLQRARRLPLDERARARGRSRRRPPRSPRARRRRGAGSRAGGGRRP